MDQQRLKVDMVLRILKKGRCPKSCVCVQSNLKQSRRNVLLKKKTDDGGNPALKWVSGQQQMNISNLS